MSLKQIQQIDPISARPKMRLSRREEAQFKYEQLWTKSPEQFPLNRSARSRFCAHAAWDLIKDLPAKTACDLGSGCGYFSRLLKANGILVDAVDIAKPALEQLTELPEKHKIQAYVPYTPLPENHYDLVIAYDLIASLPESEQRLFFSELARLAKTDATILISTNLDIDTENPLGRFLQLAQTELILEKIQLSHHSYQIRLLNYLKGFPPLKNFVRQSDRLLNFLHNLASQIQSSEQASHVILIGKKKPISSITL